MYITGAFLRLVYSGFILVNVTRAPVQPSKAQFYLYTYVINSS